MGNTRKAFDRWCEINLSPSEYDVVEYCWKAWQGALDHRNKHPIVELDPNCTASISVESAKNGEMVTLDLQTGKMATKPYPTQNTEIHLSTSTYLCRLCGNKNGNHSASKETHKCEPITKS